MIFEQLLLQAKEGNQESITDILISGAVHYTDAGYQAVPNLNL